MMLRKIQVNFSMQDLQVLMFLIETIQQNSDGKAKRKQYEE